MMLSLLRNLGLHPCTAIFFCGASLQCIVCSFCFGDDADSLDNFLWIVFDEIGDTLYNRNHFFLFILTTAAINAAGTRLKYFPPPHFKQCRKAVVACSSFQICQFEHDEMSR